MTAVTSQARARINVLLELRRWSEARSLVEAELRERPDDPDLVGWRAQCLIGEKDFTGALAAGNRLVALAPADEWGHRICSVALDSLGRDAEASRAAAEAVRLAPLRWQNHARYAMASCTVPGLGSEALRAAHEAVRLGPDQAGSHYALGYVNHRLGNTAQARAAYEKTLSIDPEHTHARNNLTTLHGSLNLLRAARGFASTLRLDPSHRAARTNLDRLVIGFPVRLYAGSVLAYAAGLVAVVAGDGPGIASWTIAALLVLTLTAYCLGTVRRIPRNVRGYFVRRLFTSGRALWNLFVWLLGTVVAILVCVLPAGETVGLVALRPIVLGAVVTGVMLLRARAR